MLFGISRIKQSAGEFTFRHTLASSKDVSKPVPHCPQTVAAQVLTSRLHSR